MESKLDLYTLMAFKQDAVAAVRSVLEAEGISYVESEYMGSVMFTTKKSLFIRIDDHHHYHKMENDTKYAEYQRYNLNLIAKYKKLMVMVPYTLAKGGMDSITAYVKECLSSTEEGPVIYVPYSAYELYDCGEDGDYSSFNKYGVKKY